MYILLFYSTIDGLKKKMLKTYSKEAIENIKKYVCDNVDFTGYDQYAYIEKFEEDAKHGKQIDLFSVYAHAIYNCFYHEAVEYDKSRKSINELFFYWCQGLPSVLDTCYYYNRSAVDDLAVILEESESEKSKFTERQAEEKLTYLIFREIKKAVSKGKKVC